MMDNHLTLDLAMMVRVLWLDLILNSLDASLLRSLREHSSVYHDHSIPLPVYRLRMDSGVPVTLGVDKVIEVTLIQDLG